MPRKLLLVALAVCYPLCAENMTGNNNPFDRNCVPCHRRLPATLQDMFKRYLLAYSSENNLKAGVYHYLRYPNKDISVMDKLFLKRFGVKSPTTLTEKELKEAVEIYWERYKVFGKLK